VLISKLVITCLVGAAVDGLQGFCTFSFVEKQPGIPILAIAGLTDYQNRVLLLLRVPPNIHRAYFLG
jgi:hypothetical protein